VTTDASDSEVPEDTVSEEHDDEATADEATEGRTRKQHKQHKQRKHLPVWQESVLLLVIALGLAVVIKSFFVQAFYIPSESMEPGLIENDRILVQKVSYWFGRDPQRGDVVVFEDPGDWLDAADDKTPTGLAHLLSRVGLYPTGGHLVKRVIGVEGDVIECCDDQGRILVNGEPVDESEYLADRPGKCNAAFVRARARSDTCDWSIGPIPDGKLFVMGDNRNHSADSRYHMCFPGEDPCTESPWVDTEMVVGKVFTLVWPRSRWTWVSRPHAFDDVPDPAAG
jgi:signal peptidase I